MQLTIKKAIELVGEMAEYWEQLIDEENEHLLNGEAKIETEIELEALRMAKRALEEKSR